MTDAADLAVRSETVSLCVINRATLDLHRVRAAFADLGWLGSSVGAAIEPGWRRIATNLELPVRDGSGPAASKAALIDVGPVRDEDDAVRVPLEWSSATFAPLFPVFAGQLEIRRSSLTLVGRYAPPFGRIGLLIDQSLLHFVATRTAQAFLARIAREVGAPLGG